ncbi:gliding motility-associated C-terminal domain-containing protein [Flavobacterium sp. ZT3R18]|uniref:gliding motility-associated C-terminal domain-containing protein n=1 Tax=Flavobacterium sp. ZT3R18 TaxID=2594429 RepID=UPI00163D967D|nr:gliding motility-associated C-terminal domain-containing protein [Flavobacterium sp. ZT3R18]
MSAQCAGNNGSLTVCDIANPLNPPVDLNALLGIHTAGGTWNDDDFSGGLNVVNGTLNVQDIKESGVFHYTYSLNNVNGCTGSAVVTITIGGYAGVAGAFNLICSSETSYNLFHVFNGTLLSPQTNGIWEDVDNKGGLSGFTLNASVPQPIPGTYSYKYTVPAIATCPPSSSTIHLTIQRKPISGDPDKSDFCSNNLASYTNLDLNSLLIGEDSGGRWTELSGTSEIGFPADYIVNIQNIYNVKGAGNYSFKYTVTPKEAICLPSASTTITIKIEQFLDFTGAKLEVNSDICENEIPTATYNAVLTRGTQFIADGSYEVTYFVTGAASSTTIVRNFVSGVLSFPIDRANFKFVKDYTISILNIKVANSPGVCTNIIGTIEDDLHVYPIPKINAATLTILPVCKNDDATVFFLGTSNLTNGDYDISYNLSGSNTKTATAVLSITEGLGSFNIPKNLIPNVGLTKITITKITNAVTGCSNTSTLNKEFTVNPLPDLSNLIVTVKDVCQGQPAIVDMTGLGTLTDISIEYTISGANVIVPPQTKSLTVVGGIKSFSIPATDIPIVGVTTFTITNVTNTLTGCSISTTIPKNFNVNPLPIIAVSSPQPFCTSDNATVANLMPQGNQYKWFDSATSTVPLISTTPLITGYYYVKEVNVVTGCESSLKTVAVIINLTPQINSAIVTIPSICQGFNANINFATGTTNLTDGNYNIFYNLSGSNTTTTPVSAILTVTNGMPSFSINSNFIPKAGNTTIAITNITNTLTHCTNTSTLTKVFVVNAVPDVSTMIVTIKDGCLGQDTNVDISGLVNLTNITLSYAVSGANTIGSQTIPLVVSTGKTSFSILGSALSTIGSNTLVITDITNAGNSCSTIINSVSKNFDINAIPNNPTAGNQTFCETDFATVANLQPGGNQYKWYASASSNTALASNALLVTANYFLKEGNPTTGCQSNATPISVLINTVTIPVLKPSGQDFCGVDKPTILSLSNNTTASKNLAWYDAVTNGKLLIKTDLLSEGATYYGFDYDSNTKCTSSPLVVTVSLTDCTATPENFFIPDGFSPNGDGVNETFQIIDIEFLFPNYNLEIFNRYGNILFKGDINKPAWDGKSSNSGFMNGDAPTGVYFYVIQYNKDNLKPKQGQLYLNR